MNQLNPEFKQYLETIQLISEHHYCYKTPKEKQALYSLFRQNQVIESSEIIPREKTTTSPDQTHQAIYREKRQLYRNNWPNSEELSKLGGLQVQLLTRARQLEITGYIQKLDPNILIELEGTLSQLQQFFSFLDDCRCKGWYLYHIADPPIKVPYRAYNEMIIII